MKCVDEGRWMYLENDDPANLPSPRYLCAECGVAFTEAMRVMGLMVVHEAWHDRAGVLQ